MGEGLRVLWSLPLHKSEVFVSHRNARLTFHGRRLLVQRVRREGMPVAHVARAMGISRQCAHRWVARFDAEGEAGLVGFFFPPRGRPTRGPAGGGGVVVAGGGGERRGEDFFLSWAG